MEERVLLRVLPSVSRMAEITRVNDAMKPIDTWMNTNERREAMRDDGGRSTTVMLICEILASVTCETEMKTDVQPRHWACALRLALIDDNESALQRGGQGMCG